MTDQWYCGQDDPTSAQKEKMWREIQLASFGRRRWLLFIPEFRSFAYGVAASVVIYFSAVGVLSTVQDSITSARPDAVKLDEAYQSAIRQFEHVVSRREVGETQALSGREAELKKLNAVIGELQSAAGEGDLSPLIRKRLRRLYSLKLQVLQEMIENGGVEL